VMKPKPFASLNHFTVPLAILMLLIRGDISPHIIDGSRCFFFSVDNLGLILDISDAEAEEEI